MMLYEDKLKENHQLKEKLESVQQIQTAMLAYVLSQQNQPQSLACSSAFYGLKKDTTCLQ